MKRREFIRTACAASIFPFSNVDFANSTPFLTVPVFGFLQRFGREIGSALVAATIYDVATSRFLNNREREGLNNIDRRMAADFPNAENSEVRRGSGVLFYSREDSAKNCCVAFCESGSGNQIGIAEGPSIVALGIEAADLASKDFGTRTIRSRIVPVEWESEAAGSFENGYSSTDRFLTADSAYEISYGWDSGRAVIDV
ncbi:MAG: hypothetical protein AAFY73_12375, partial [Pseudomonadota bacterium]